MRNSLYVFTLMCFVGCVMPTFQNPVVEPDDAIQDEKLIGE